MHHIDLCEAYKNKEKYITVDYLDYESEDIREHNGFYYRVYRCFAVINGDCNKSWLVKRANAKEGWVELVIEKDDPRDITDHEIIKGEIVIFPLNVNGEYFPIDYKQNGVVE